MFYVSVELGDRLALRHGGVQVLPQVREDGFVEIEHSGVTENPLLDTVGSERHLVVSSVVAEIGTADLSYVVDGLP